MRRGFSLAELAVMLAILGVITALVLPRWKDLLDWVAVDRSAVEVSTALAVTRNAAVLGNTRARLLIADDSLRIDRWEA
jgi:prepilin-type N-terminal cleavage/methylation domain-containing protein